MRYWYNDHKSGKRKVAELPVLRFIGRMVQHMLPQGVHRIRYYGLHTTCKHQRVKSLLQWLWVAMGRAIKGTYRVVRHQSYQERVMESGRSVARATLGQGLAVSAFPRYVPV